MGIGELKPKEDFSIDNFSKPEEAGENLVIIDREVMAAMRESLEESFSKVDFGSLPNSHVDMLQQQFNDMQKPYTEKEQEEQKRTQYEINQAKENLKSILIDIKQIREKMSPEKQEEYKSMAEQIFNKSEKINFKIGFQGIKEKCLFIVEEFQKLLERMKREINEQKSAKNSTFRKIITKNKNLI